MNAIFLNLAFLVIVNLLGCTHRSGHHVFWKPGQSLHEVAHHHQTDVDKLRRFNPEARPGEWVFVPNTVGVLPLMDETEALEDYSELGNSDRWSWPVPSIRKISSGYGHRWGRKHEGIDIAGPRGTPFVAISEGIVRYSGRKIRGYGNMIVIEHPGEVFSVYAHNQKNLVRRGQRVKRGQKIGLIGRSGRATGSHLHFEIRQGKTPKDPEQIFRVARAR
jgi:murein DD-endopeptidase MepM/ murein hydrolase activator NlpD